MNGSREQFPRAPACQFGARRRSSPRSSKHKKLVEKLAVELRENSAELQPLILEEEIPTTASRHIQVIWDQWQGIDAEKRAAIRSKNIKSHFALKHLRLC